MSSLDYVCPLNLFYYVSIPLADIIISQYLGAAKSNS